MAKIVKNVGATQRRINPKSVAKVLGAEKIGVKIDTRQGSISLFFLRQFLINQLRSDGGRPALMGVRKKRRNKVPFFDEDWVKLKMIAKYYKEKEKINVSPGQIASALVHTDISRIDTSQLASTLNDR